MGKRRTAEAPEAEENDTVLLLPSDRKKPKRSAVSDPDAFFVGKPIPATEARAKWPHRYSNHDKKGSVGSSNESVSLDFCLFFLSPTLDSKLLPGMCAILQGNE
jgi:DNA (cytosine-5)-methyltransferase 1